MYRAPRKVAKYASRHELTIIGRCACTVDFDFMIVAHYDTIDVIGHTRPITDPASRPIFEGYITYDKGKYRVIASDEKPALIALAGVTLLSNIDIPEDHWEKIVSSQVMEAL